MSLGPDDRYRARMRGVLEHIDVHLDEDLDLDRLSEVACFSKYHFHRQFTGLYGVSVLRYVQMRRLKRAAHELAFRPKLSVLEIAVRSGYEGPEAFARAFKRIVGQTPSEFRDKPSWDAWFESYDPIHEIRSAHMSSNLRFADVRIVDFPETRIAALEHCGDPRYIGDSIRKFVAWRKRHQLHPSRHATYNIFYNDPEEIEPARFRMDLAVGVGRDFGGNSDGILLKTIPAGRCAVVRHVGSDEGLDAAIRRLYAEWLPQSGEELRDFPLYLQRIAFFPDVPEHEAVSDLFLPLRD